MAFRNLGARQRKALALRTAIGVGAGLLAGAVAGCSASGGGTIPPGGSGGGTNPNTGGATFGTGGDPSGAGGQDPGAGGVTSTAGGAGNQGTGGNQVYLPSGADAGAYQYPLTTTFDWPESKPTAGSCKAGLYCGTFSGIYVSPAVASFPIPIAGNVSLTLLQSSDGEFFKLANGTIAGLVYGIIPFSSGLTGTLDCNKATLVDGFMPNGKYDVLGTDYHYEGPIHGDYDKLTHEFKNTGTWVVGEPTLSINFVDTDPRPANGGEGSWGANYTAAATCP